MEYKLSNSQRAFLHKIHKEQHANMNGYPHKFNHGIAQTVENVLITDKYNDSDQKQIIDMIRRYRLHLDINIVLTRNDLVFDKNYSHRDTLSIYDFKSTLHMDKIHKADSVTFIDNDGTEILLKNRYK